MGFLFSILLFFTMTFNQGDAPYTSVEQAFKSNDAKSIVDLSKDKILINVLGDEGAYSKSQATLVLKDFFTKHPGSSFQFIHKGSGSGDGAFAIGKYISKGIEYRVTIQFKKIGGAYKIESLAIEK